MPMNLKNSFKSFANRVVHALRMGKLPDKDVKMMERLLLRTEKKNLILSRALLSALAGGEQSEADVKKFAHLLEIANRRIVEGKEPFSIEEKKGLEEMFMRHSLSVKAARKFAFGIDELLAMELKTQMEGEKVLPKQSKGQQERRRDEKERLVH